MSKKPTPLPAPPATPPRLPSEGGAWTVGADGKLVRDDAPAAPAAKET